MPPPDEPELTDEEIATIRRWITRGAPPFPISPKPPEKSDERDDR